MKPFAYYIGYAQQMVLLQHVYNMAGYDESDNLHAKTSLWRSWNYYNHSFQQPIKTGINY